MDNKTVKFFWVALSILVIFALGIIGYGHWKMQKIDVVKSVSQDVVCNETSINDVAVALKSKLQNTSIKEITCSELGLYKVVSGDNQFYTDEQGRFLFFGSVYDLDGQREVSTSFQAPELTKDAPQLEQYVKWEDLPLGNAIVVGDGDIELAVYKDINCPYCQRLYEALETMPNVKVYYMMTSIFGERSAKPTAEILCSNSPKDELANYMATKRIENGNDCKAGRDAIQTVFEFGNQQGWQGTPVTVRKSDGKVMVGFSDKENLETFLKGE